MKIVQNNIQSILNQHSIIPVVTISKINEIEPKINFLLNRNIKCIEVTLRTKVAFEAFEFIKKNYGNKICVGVGTVINIEQIHRLEEIGVDFIVSPGISEELTKELLISKIPFILLSNYQIFTIMSFQPFDGLSLRIDQQRVSDSMQSY